MKFVYFYVIFMKIFSSNLELSLDKIDLMMFIELGNIKYILNFRK